MKTRYRKIIISSIALIPIALLVAHSLRTHPPDDDPMMKVFSGKASGLKILQMTDELRALANGDEQLVLLQTMFAAAPEFPSFPLIQKKGDYLGSIPNSFADVVPMPDLVISTAGKKTCYKFQFLSSGVEVTLVAIPENRMTNMGQLPKNKWLKPKDVGFSGNFPHHFKLTAVDTPKGDINYWVFVSDDNPDINKVMQAYMEHEKAKGKRE